MGTTAFRLVTGRYPPTGSASQAFRLLLGPARRALAAPVPKEPLKGQRRPPCDSHQVEINGGCWLAVHDVTDGVHLKAPCREATYSHDGKCYTPSYVPPRPPTSEPQ